ncbi:MAG: hypothetical protein ACYC7D_09795 [Nitrososphaerales archaeon]
MVALDLSSARKIREIRYTVHEYTILIAAIDDSGNTTLFQSMRIDVVEGRSLSFKAKKVYEYSTGEKLQGKIRSISVKPPDFFREFGQGFVQNPT